MSDGSDDARAPADEEGIARNAAFAFATQALTVASTAVLTVFLVRALGPAGYGVFALAIGIGALLETPSDFGISSSMARFIAERRGDHGAIAAIIADGLRLKLIAGGAVSIALFAAAGPIAAGYDAPALAAPLRAVAVAVFGQGLLVLYANALSAQGRSSLYLRAVASKAAVELAASIALVLLGGGALGAAAGRAAGFGFGAAIGTLLVVRLLGGRALAVRGVPSPRQGEIFRYAGALLLVDGAFTVFSHIDVLLIGAFLGTTAVGIFEAPLRLTNPLYYAGQALATGVAPRLSGETHRGAAMFTAGLRYLVIVQAAVTVPALVWAEPIVRLVLGPSYDESADVLQALAPFIFLAGIAPLVTMGANYLGQARRRVPIAIAAVLLNLVIDLALIPKIGIVAGAIGTSVAFLVYVPAHVWICRRALGFSLRPMLRTSARALLAAAAMALVMLEVDPSDLRGGAAAVGVTGGLLAFVAVLTVTGELSRADARVARGLWRRMRGART